VAPWRIVPEAKARGTAPAVAAAAELLHREDPEALLLVLPADHLIRDVVASRHAVETGHRAARGGALVAFGAPARSPQTGFGCVHRGATWPGIPGCYVVTIFVEKPNAQLAAQIIAAASCYWNSGIFLFRADAFLAEYERFDLDGRTARREAVWILRAQAIDRAVLEKTDKAAVRPVGGALGCG
jgi:mannose-1-phosphate guanylyltransferase / mannose-6-phosphate isomerase